MVCTANWILLYRPRRGETLVWNNEPISSVLHNNNTVYLYMFCCFDSSPVVGTAVDFAHKCSKIFHVRYNTVYAVFEPNRLARPFLVLLLLLLLLLYTIPYCYCIVVRRRGGRCVVVGFFFFFPSSRVRFLVFLVRPPYNFRPLPLSHTSTVAP